MGNIGCCSIKMFSISIQSNVLSQNVPLKMFHTKCSQLEEKSALLRALIKMFLSNCFLIRRKYCVEGSYQNVPLKMFSLNVHKVFC